MAINSGLFGHAGNATNQWADAQRQEGLIGNDNNIEDTVNKYKTGGENPDEEPDLNLEPAKPEYFTYDFDEESKTATLTGINPDYAIRSLYADGEYGEIYYNSGIQDGELVISEFVLPTKVTYKGDEYTVTHIGDECFYDYVDWDRRIEAC